ncbi:hypothetical protein F0267_13945 [Vibrio coralliilyticus]|uniref:Uncharacterized protein n=1 Tax=Vibrio coralliilyticus TaxID=190893 RepID=A0AAN0SHB9_9VIBR|nr:hypothetical protein [Vibrio coralliilyticus]AIW21135.1 hypothetical protein IX92_19075 [Vibrio coralliilyticus]NOH39343.1 hypothetical protein [Vibrio coralliilyticus]
MSKFGVTVKNSSGTTYQFYLFQQDPDLFAQNFKSTAWLTHPYKTATGVTDEFDWTIDYGLVWSATTTIKPGTVLKQHQDTSVDLNGNPNTVKFTYANDTPQFELPATKSGNPGSFYIDTVNANPIIPKNTFAFGLTVNEKMAFTTMGENGQNLKMTPKPTYWITAAKTVAQNEVLDASVSTGAVELKFKNGLNYAFVELDSNNNFSDPIYQATPFQSIAVLKTELVMED